MSKIKIDRAPWKCPKCKNTVLGLWEVGGARVCTSCGTRFDPNMAVAPGKEENLNRPNHEMAYDLIFTEICSFPAILKNGEIFKKMQELNDAVYGIREDLHALRPKPKYKNPESPLVVSERVTPLLPRKVSVLELLREKGFGPTKCPTPLEAEEIAKAAKVKSTMVYKVWQTQK